MSLDVPKALGPPPAPMVRRHWWLLAFALLLHAVVQLRPAFERVTSTPSGMDYASYYYAVQVAADGGDPYDVGVLGTMARAEQTRRTVQPYFYPPPFLLAMVWGLPLKLATAFDAMLVWNELLLAGCLWLLWRSFAVAPWAIALLLTCYTPITDNAWMGQANLWALFPTLAGLAVVRRRPWLGGVLVGIAGMLKMSPAVFVVWFLLRGNWRAFVAAGLTALGLSVLSLPLVHWPEQFVFFTEVLPGFGRGDYHGLTVPISLPANHSVPDLFARVWPGDTPTSMSDAALLASRSADLLLLGLWAGLVRGRREPGNEPLALGMLCILMVVLPAYAYEHHLVLVVLPLAISGTVVLRTRSPGMILLWALCAFFVGWPLTWLRAAQDGLPMAGDLIRESKFLGLGGIFALSGVLFYRGSIREK